MTREYGGEAEGSEEANAAILVQDVVASGVPLEGEAELGYRLRGYDLPPLMFSAEELEAVLLGVRFVQQWADPALLKPAGDAPDKIRTVLPDYPAFGESLHHGPALAGGKLRVEYDGRRLRETRSCFGSRGAVSSTTIKMGYRFDGVGGAPRSVEVERYIKKYGSLCQPHAGSPCVDQTISKPLLELPASATGLQLWFYCLPGFSSGAPHNWKPASRDKHHPGPPRPAARPRLLHSRPAAVLALLPKTRSIRPILEGQRGAHGRRRPPVLDANRADAGREATAPLSRAVFQRRLR